MLLSLSPLLTSPPPVYRIVSDSINHVRLNDSKELTFFSHTLLGICSFAWQPFLMLRGGERERAVFQTDSFAMHLSCGVDSPSCGAMRGHWRLSKNSPWDPVMYLANSLVNYVTLTISRGSENHTWAGRGVWLSAAVNGVTWVAEPASAEVYVEVIRHSPEIKGHNYLSREIRFLPVTKQGNGKSNHQAKKKKKK